MNERDLLQRVEAADTAEFARILRDVSAEEARVLTVHFGEAQFENLRRISLLGTTRGTSKGDVVVLHGILGGELTVLENETVKKHVWVSVRRLMFGGFQRLTLEPAEGAVRVEATGILKKYYGEQLLRLSQQGWNVRAFWYDWRLDVDKAAERLRDRLNEWFPGKPVHLVAHSMGGLVARSFIRQNGPMWNAMGTRLVMLGTPNNGSFNAPQLFSGWNSVVKMVSRLDVTHGLDSILRVLRTFPSAFQLLPNPHYMKTDEERGVWSHERYAIRPDPGKFDRAARFWQEITPVADPERMIYVAGTNQVTAVGVKDLSRLGSKEGYEFSMAGDGTVPHRLGLLHTPTGELIPTFYADCEHGAMPNDALIGEGVDALLSGTGQGRLRTEPQLKPLPSRGADEAEGARLMAGDQEADWDESASRAVSGLQMRGEVREEEIDSTPLSAAEREAEELMLSGFLSPGMRGEVQAQTEAGTFADAAIAPGPALAPKSAAQKMMVEVLHQGIQENFEWPGVDSISVGHYVGVMPAASEGALSDAISPPESKREETLLSEFTRRGIIHGGLGEVFVLPDPRRAERVLLVAGMGVPGQFSHVELRSCVRQMLWTACRMGRKHVATVLIGSGEGNVALDMAVAAWLRAIVDMQVDGTLPWERIRKITFCETSPSRTRQVRLAISDGIQRLGLKDRIEVSPESDRDRELLDQSMKDEIEKRLRLALKERSGRVAGRTASRLTVTQDSGRYTFSALTNTASIPERVVRIDKLLVDEANDLFPSLSSVAEQRRHGEFFKRLLLPEDFESVFRTPDPVVVVCDSTTATLHWEMTAMPSAIAESDGPSQGFLGLDRGLTRQFKTTFAALGVRQSLTQGPTLGDGILRVLVVIDPAQDRRLPAAEKEGNAVAKFFFGLQNQWAEKYQPVNSRIQGVSVRVLHGPSEATRLRVLQELLTTKYDILHYAGHCVYDKADPMKSGWIFTGNTRLTANELRRIGQAPSFIFSNACESGITPDRSELRKAELPVTFAESFFAQGVQNFICTAWPVNDEAACAFAETFYGECLEREGEGAMAAKPIHAAMRAARTKIIERADGKRTWGAYQHYGDPYARLF